MAELRVRFDLSFGVRTARCLMAAAMVLSAVSEVASESVTLTTYYPAPSGVYAQMITTGNTYLARDGGAVGIQTTSPAAGYVLDANGSTHVAGSIKMDGAGLYNSFGYQIVAGNQSDWLRINQNNSWPSGTAAYGYWAFGSGGVSIGSWTDMPSGDLYVTSRVGIGTSSPSQSLDVAGAAAAYGYLPHYQSWAAYGTGDGGAAIYNDNNGYKTLMIVGNSSGGGERRVSVWDRLMVNGPVIPTDSACTETWYNIDGYTPCPAGQYATVQSGVISYYTIMPVYASTSGGGTQTTAPMFCCNCPASGCPL